MKFVQRRQHHCGSPLIFERWSFDVEEARTVFDHRAFRFGTVLGGFTLLAALGAFKNFMALFSGEREGYVLFGFLALQYSASQVWFGYAFTGLTGQLLRIPHIILYSAAAYGLWTRQKWAWYLVFSYLLYILLSLGVVMLFYFLGRV